MNSGIFSSIDANVNRALEGVRVVEDYFRFVVHNNRISVMLKQMRHDIADASGAFPPNLLLSSRDVAKDAQKYINTEGEQSRKSGIDVVRSNLHRVMEAVRSIEEFYKLAVPDSVENPFQKIRFSLYSAEKDIVSFISRDEKRKFFNSSLYAILDSSFVMNDAYSETAKRMINGGAKIIQLRMKNHSMRNILKTAKQICALCRGNNVLFIVNDYPEIAYLSDADGVHLGQDDLTVKDVRSFLPMEMLIGISTHSVKEAEAELENDPDYIAIGPVFDTASKHGETIKGIGLDVVEHIVEKSEVPVVGIGGLNSERISMLKKIGCSCFAVISFLYAGRNIEENCKKIINSI